jgi:hypothetical protein
VLCDLRARDLLQSNAALLNNLAELGETMRQRLKQVLEQVHGEITAAFQGSAAGRLALRFYLYFDLFDAVQFPMMFGTDVVASETVEIIRIAPEDAARLMPDLQQRRQKLKGLAVAHFGAFLDRDWRVSDLLWGRLDAAERLIAALLPWENSKQLREQLIDQAHSGIFADFGIQTKLKEMATRQVVAQGPENKLSDQAVSRLVNTVVPNSTTPSLDTHRQLMEVWQDGPWLLHARRPRIAGNRRPDRAGAGVVGGRRSVANTSMVHSLHNLPARKPQASGHQGALRAFALWR